MRGVGACIRDIFKDGAAEQDRLLRHDADGTAQRLERQRANVDPVQRDAAFADVPEARNEARDGRLAATGPAHHRDDFAGGERQRQTANDFRQIVGVAERHVVEDHGTTYGLRQCTRLRGIDHRRLGVEQFKHPRGRADRFLKIPEQRCQRTDGRRDRQRVKQKRHECARGQPSADDLHAALPHHRNHRSEGDEPNDAEECRTQLCAFHRGRHDIGKQGGETRRLLAFARETLHGANGTERFVGCAHRVRHPILHADAGFPQCPAEHDRRANYQRHDGQRRQRQLRIRDGEHEHAADQKQSLTRELRHPGAHQ